VTEDTQVQVGGSLVCPFVAFEDDRDHRSTAPDYRHRCFAAAEPEPRAFPHQERFCLSSGFAACPVFLDWARQEAAGVRQADGAAAARAKGVAPFAATDDDGGPAFLSSRGGRAESGAIGAAGAAAGAAAGSTGAPGRHEGSSALWSFEGESVHDPHSHTNHVAPSSLGSPAASMARRGPTHPGWENPPRLESYPRLRARDDRRANQPLLYAAVGVALLMVALVLLPILTASHGGGGTGGASPTPAVQASGSVKVSASPTRTITPAAEFTYMQYSVRSGESLTIIANRFNLKLWEIELANPQITDFNHLEVGQIINIPPAGLLTQPPVTPSPGAP
jgi:hypothetical protein